MSAFLPTARAEWRNDTNTIAWCAGGRPVWSFSFDSREGKPHFASLAPGGRELVEVHPADHSWHYGLWFSWKFINGVNYWEETGPGHRAAGTTRWQAPEIGTDAAGNATIRLTLDYVNPVGRTEITERRTIRVSAPDSEGGFAIDWAAHFTVVSDGVVLDRTPLLGEPGGQIYGGYGGLGLRLPAAVGALSVVVPQGEVTRYEHERTRPQAGALACNLGREATARGGVAILNLDATTGAAEELSWYVANTEVMRFACAAILAPKALTLGAGATLDLRYRILVRPTAWTPAALREAIAAKRE